MHKVSVIEYGSLANIFNVSNALEKLDCKVQLASTPEDILMADKLILPGVGAFQDGIEKLKANQLNEAIGEYAKTGKPLLGICLGMQLLMEKSYEFGIHNGLGIISGEVIRFNNTDPSLKKHKVPNVGWLSMEAGEGYSSKGLLNENMYNNHFYFVHSYYVKTSFSKNDYALSTYADTKFTAIVRNENIWGCQFHPELSGKNGLDLLRNFLLQ
jgi:glutamine amidotransferase